MDGPTETFLIDSELIRDALSAALWTRLCSELRQGSEPEELLDSYIERFATGRGDQTQTLQYLDEDIDSLSTARRHLRVVQDARLGDQIELNDVRRFMPYAWRDAGPTGPGVWLYTTSRAEEAELLAPETVTWVRRPRPSDEYAL